MQGSILEKFTIERSLIFVVILAILVVFGFIIILFFLYGARSIQLLSPNGGEEWEIGQSYEINWKARGIERVGIVLYKGTEPKWIAKNLSAKSGKYEWKIQPGQEYGPGFWIAVFEFPWKKGNKIDYSDSAFSITFPELATCDHLSIEQEWPYLASDLPNLRRVFITEESYTGNLDGLEGADKICQQEAEKQNFGGTWQAFLGGDSDEETAIKRLEGTPKGKDGVFVLALPSATLIRGDTCHRLLARNFDQFLARFSGLKIINAEKLEKQFLENMGNLWLGRLDAKSKKNCTAIAAFLGDYYRPLAEKYSFTTTCQNWTQESKIVEAVPPFPTCYTPAGIRTEAIALAGLASGLEGKGKDTNYTGSQGKSCNQAQKLLCIEK